MVTLTLLHIITYLVTLEKFASFRIQLFELSGSQFGLDLRPLWITGHCLKQRRSLRLPHRGVADPGHQVALEGRAPGTQIPE